jgi:putative ABC transport system permease protein
VLLGQTVAKSLFGEADPVGETVRIRRVPHQVIGVLERKGQSMVGQDQDDVVLIPISTARKRVLGRTAGEEPQRGALDHRARARRRRHVVTEQDIRELMRQRHRLRPGAEDDFTCAT